MPHGCLNELDSALNELGMLSTRTRSCDEYLSEIQNKKFVNMLTINTRYVSNVSFGYRLRPSAPHTRYKPYKIPKERHRTRSENNDGDATTSVTNTVLDGPDSTSMEELNQLKKAKSLESIVAERSSDENLAMLRNITILNSQEMDVVSNSIQKLNVNE